MKQVGTITRLGVLFLCSLPVYAQGGVVTTPGGGSGGTTTGGCVNSPENPTALLALVGTAGGAFTFLRARSRSRKEK